MLTCPMVFALRAFALCSLLFYALSQAHAGVIDQDVRLWVKPRHEVITCFIESRRDLTPKVMMAREASHNVRGVAAEMRAQIQSAVEKSFSPSSTGIYFSGWRSCGETSNPDIYIGEADLSVAGAAGSIGAPIGKKTASSIMISTGYFQKRVLERLRPVISAYQLQIDEDKVSLEIARTMGMKPIVHEFGHLAGLRHEHIISAHYSEMLEADLNGKIEHLVRLNDPTDSEANTKLVGAYDLFSSMSYLFIRNDFTMHLIRVLCVAQNQQKATLSFTLDPAVCNFPLLDSFLNLNGDDLSLGDHEALRSIYLNEAMKLDWLKDNDLKLNFIKNTLKPFVQSQPAFQANVE